MKKFQILLGLGLILATTIAPISWITSAYAMSLTSLGVVSPDGAFNRGMKTIKKHGEKATVFVSSMPGGFTADVFSLDGGMNEFTGPVVFNSETFMTRLIASVKKNQSLLLWSSYPASIRGQVFSNATPGGNPIETSGW
jgi:hypothetical protein